jgi:prepilin-type N-terminal cleavage/methylation domain-containing protein
MTTIQTIRNGARAGFTLIEMLIVVVILGILAMVIIPQVSTSTDDAKLSTLQTNLSAMRNSVELYYAQHTSAYPGDVVPTTKPNDVTTTALAFVAQLTRYTDANGNISNSKSAVYKYGPYIKGSGLPTNPFNDLDTITIDDTETDITVKASGSATGWKFYSKTGVMMADDGANDTE